MDRRKDNGGAREGAGRKPKFAEQEVKDQIDKAAGKEGLSEVWKTVIAKAKKGSAMHTNTLFNYYYGKPKETKDINLGGDIIVDFPHEEV